jgi:hypothetical protein
MAYKKEKPIIQGTDTHRSALKNLGLLKGGGKLASRAIPGLGWALAAYDVGKLGYYSIKKGSLKEGAKDLGRDYGLSFDDDNKKSTTQNKKSTTQNKKSKESVYRTTPKTDYKKKSKLPTYEQSYTSEVANKWKDKGGKSAYIQAAKDWNAKNR